MRALTGVKRHKRNDDELVKCKKQSRDEDTFPDFKIYAFGQNILYANRLV